jgi:hypothetical protein
MHATTSAAGVGAGVEAAEDSMAAGQNLRALVMQSSAPATGAPSPWDSALGDIEDSISQCTFLQMTYTAENPHADGSAAPGARPRFRPPLTDAFSQVPHLSGVRYCMSMATAMKWKASGVDLTQGFIQADLSKDGKAIYISPPPGHAEESDVVYQVLKPLYGMPHSGRCLHLTWSNWLESQGFQKAGYEGAMWSKKDKDGDAILVAMHVDDSIVTGSDDDKTDTFVREMLDRFDGTCERNLTEMLGMEWERDIEAGTSILHQRAFTEKLLKTFGFWQYCKPTKTPQAPGTRLSAADKPDTPDPVLHSR